MKQPKKPTREQKAILLGHKMNPAEWMYVGLVKDTESYIKFVHKSTGVFKTVDIYKKGKL